MSFLARMIGSPRDTAELQVPEDLGRSRNKLIRPRAPRGRCRTLRSPRATH
jgi:hypothetical protein